MNIVSKQTIQDLLKKHDIHPSKRLGQNFLIDKNVLKKIIEAGELKPDDIVLEIGPGLGILTLELAKRAKKVIAVEKDRTLCQLLSNILKSVGINNVKIINKDVLQISNFPACAEASAGRKFLISKQIRNSNFKIDSKFKIINYKLVANLPYYITSPVIRKFLEADPPASGKPEFMILMVQKEVAQRIVAKPPHMNLLAVSVQFYAVPKIISYVSKTSFWPRPKVDSAIIKITPYVGDRNSHINSEGLFKLVKAGFSSKRKMLKNNLKIDESILKKIGLNPKIRAENLTIIDWIKLYENL